MSLDFFLSEEEMNHLALEVEELESDIESANDEYVIDAKLSRLDQIIQMIEVSKRNICQTQQVVTLF